MSLSRADVKCLTLKSLWGWKGWFEAEQALCGIKFAWRPSMTWIPPFLSPSSSLYASPLSRIKRCCYSNERSFFLSPTLLPLFFLFLFLLFKRRVVTWQDNVLPGHNGGWKREFTSNRRFILEKREMERFVSFEFVNSFLVIISKRIIEIFIIDFWWNLDWNIFQILRGDFFLKRIVRIFHFP